MAEAWFFHKGWTPYPFQKQTWAAIERGESGLLNAPTGYGKTFALWFGILKNYYKQKSRPPGLHCLWITPLRALSREILHATREVSSEFSLDYTIELRTGDTPGTRRKSQLRNPPHALVTTPESMHLMLSVPGYAAYFRNLEFIVIDEWHELLGSKRGVLVELALSRLKTMCPGLKIWGISATIGNLEEACRILLGSDRRGRLIKAALRKRWQMETLLPDRPDRFPWAGHLGLHMADKVVNVIEAHRSTLLFTNTRSQAEIWYQHLLALRPGLAGAIALHHGSLSEELRQWVEEALHNGRLKAVVCTSSLDLGVDFHPVDCVVQIGSPKGIARFIQRAGRSGHQPGAVSRIYFLPTHSLEIMEGHSLRYALEKGLLEQRLPYIRSFDVLLQYMVTLAVSDGFRADTLFTEIRTTNCFSSVTPEEFGECLLLITRGGHSLDAYEEFHKVVIEDDVYRVTNKQMAMRHRLSIGAIVSDAVMRVKYRKGKDLGTIEESFVARLRPGDEFWFAGRQLSLVGIRDMQVIVRAGGTKKGSVPSWMGGRLPVSAPLGAALRHTLSAIRSVNTRKHRELTFLEPLFGKQELLSFLPTGQDLLIEYIKTRYGYHLFLFPFEGKLIHEGMAAVLAHRLGKWRKATFSLASNEYGLELLSDSEIEIDYALAHGLFSTDGLMEDISRGMNITEMAKRKFREITGIAGLVFRGYPGRQQKTKHIQASSALFFKVFEEYDSQNLLLRQAYREVYDFQLEATRMLEAFRRIGRQHIVLSTPKKLTPFAFPVFAESFRERYSNEDWQARLEKLKQQLEQ